MELEGIDVRPYFSARHRAHRQWTHDGEFAARAMPRSSTNGCWNIALRDPQRLTPGSGFPASTATSRQGADSLPGRRDLRHVTTNALRQKYGRPSSFPIYKPRRDRHDLRVHPQTGPRRNSRRSRCDGGQAARVFKYPYVHHGTAFPFETDDRHDAHIGEGVFDRSELLAPESLHGRRRRLGCSSDGAF